MFQQGPEEDFDFKIKPLRERSGSALFTLVHFDEAWKRCSSLVCQMKDAGRVEGTKSSWCSGILRSYMRAKGLT